MGSAFDRAVDTVPVHTVYLDTFWIDQTEVTNEMFARFVQSTGYVTDAERAGGSNYFRTMHLEIIWEKVGGMDWNHPHGESSNISGIALSFMFHGMMQMRIARGQSAGCQPRPSGRKLPPGMIVQAKNIFIPGGMIFLRGV